MHTERLTLRRWESADLKPFAVMNADERVMAWMPSLLTYEQSEAMVTRIENHFERHGFGLWAVERRETTEFIGYVGLLIPAFEAHFTPCVEIGWRLAYDCWNQGLATEAAQRVVRFAFEELDLPELVSFTVPGNRASRRVMEKLSMAHSPTDDFQHPALPADHRLAHHVLYRLSREQWTLSPS